MTPPRLTPALPMALLAALVAAAAAPADEASFDAAWHRAGMHESRFGGLPSRQRIAPRWLEEGAVMVYRVRTGAYSEEVVRVDCRSGERRVLATDDPLARGVAHDRHAPGAVARRVQHSTPRAAEPELLPVAQLAVRAARGDGDPDERAQIELRIR